MFQRMSHKYSDSINDFGCYCILESTTIVLDGNLSSWNATTKTPDRNMAQITQHSFPRSTYETLALLGYTGDWLTIQERNRTEKNDTLSATPNNSA